MTLICFSSILASSSHSAHTLATTNTQDAGNKRKPEQTRTQSAMSEHNRRLAGAIAAYGKSLDVNKKRRPASANVFTERSAWYLVYWRDIGDICGYIFQERVVICVSEDSHKLEKLTSKLGNRKVTFTCP